MNSIVISILIVLFGRILADLLFNLKIEMFNRGNAKGIIGFNFLESIIGMFIIKTVLDLVDKNIFLLVFLGVGSATGGLLVLFIRNRINLKLIGQRKYYVRLSYTGNEDLEEILRAAAYNLTIEKKKYLDGSIKSVIEGSFESRDRKEEFKRYLKGRPDKHVTIIAAREVYWVG